MVCSSGTSLNASTRNNDHTELRRPGSPIRCGALAWGPGHLMINAAIVGDPVLADGRDCPQRVIIGCPEGTQARQVLTSKAGSMSSFDPGPRPERLLGGLGHAYGCLNRLGRHRPAR